jgi:hypothetical protein
VRVWDVSPGYLSRQRLLGEHREVHALYVVLTQERAGYSRHPETLRWKRAVTGLVWRHAHLVAEMRLRGYTDATPLTPRGRLVWPATFVTEPADQFALLATKYRPGEAGRIPLPRSAQQLWAQHKYSCLARDVSTYRRLGKAVSAMRTRQEFGGLARALAVLLRVPPTRGGIMDAAQHMWGHVSRHAGPQERAAARSGARGLLTCTQALAWRVGERFLLGSTALGELGAYIDRA